MSEKYFPSHKDGHDINVNLNLNGYATKDDIKNLNADTLKFCFKNKSRPFKR